MFGGCEGRPISVIPKIETRDCASTCAERRTPDELDELTRSGSFHVLKNSPCQRCCRCIDMGGAGLPRTPFRVGIGEVDSDVKLKLEHVLRLLLKEKPG
jgi:hypothetical protein